MWKKEKNKIENYIKAIKFNYPIDGYAELKEALDYSIILMEKELKAKNTYTIQEKE